MMARKDIPFAGILVPDDRIRTAGAASTIVESGTTTTAYQQAGPTAAGAVDLGSDTVVALSGNQSESVYLNIGRGGQPDPARGARLQWADSAADTLLGWSPPSWLQYSTGTADLSGSDAFDMIALANGTVMMAAANGSTTQCVTYAPDTDTFTARANLPFQATAATPTEGLLALWQDPVSLAVYALQTDVGHAFTRRMLVKSTDNGSSWTTVAQASFSGGTIIDAARDARWLQLDSGTHVLVLIGVDSVQTWQSSSGEDWRLVGSIDSIFNGPSAQRAAADVVLLPDGRLVYAYVLAATRTIMRVRLCDALADPATAVELSAVTVSGFLNEVTLALEETGRLWALVNHTSNGVRCFRSLDYSNWLEDNGNRLLPSGSVDANHEFRKCLQLAGDHMLCTGTVNLTAPLFYRLGGWTSLEPWSVAAGLSARDSDRLTWGASNTPKVPWQGVTGSQRQTDLTAFGWQRTDTGGGETVTPVARTITTTGGSYDYSAVITGTTDSLLAFWDVQINTTGTISTQQVGWRVSTDAGSNGQSIACAISSTRFRLSEVGGVSLVTVTADMSTRMQFMVCIESGNRLEVYYKRPSAVTWISAYQTSSPNLTGSGISPAKITFGHLFSGTQESEWRFCACVASTSSASTTAKRDQWRSTISTETARQKVLGRPLASVGGLLGNPSVYPAVSLLSVAPTAGIAATVEPAHAYPIDNLDPISSPSPRQVWRSTDVTEQVLEFHLSSLQTADLTYYALYLAGANFRTALLEYFDGSWQPWVEVDLGEPVTFARTGDTVETTSGATRWLQQHEAVGGHVDLGSSTLRAIDWNSTGYGSADGTRSRVRLSGATNSDPASGAGVVVLPRGVAASLQQVTARRVRLRIPAQATAQGYFELGVAAIGRVYALGSPVDFGSGQSTLINVREDEAPGFMTRARRAPPRRRWSLAIAEANVAGIRDAAAGYLAADGAPSIGVGIEGDVAPLLEGLLAQGIDASPVLVLPAPPQTQDASNAYTTTENRRDVLWWGRVSAVQWDNVTGELGVSELHRVATVNIEEDV